MSEPLSNPLIACTTREQDFGAQIEAAAKEIGSRFWTSHDLRLTFQHCQNSHHCCIVVDCESTGGLRSELLIGRPDERLLVLAVVRRGDVRAALRSADAGAINVVEKPIVSRELIINLKTALASDIRLQEIRESGERFASSRFDGLTEREKRILGLLVDGETNHRVAEILDVEIRIVEAERAEVMKKLDVHSYVGLIKLIARLEFDERLQRKEIFWRMLSQEFDLI